MTKRRPTPAPRLAQLLVCVAVLMPLGPSAGCGDDHDGDHDHDHGEGEGHSPDHDHGDGDEGDHGPAHGAEGHGGEDEHGHAHGEGAIAITVFSEELEVFAEHVPAVAGEALSLAAHVTVLDGFSAPTEGRLTFAMTGPATLSAAADRPSRPGIFEVTVAPTIPGEYQGRFTVELPGSDDPALVVEGFGVTVFEDARAAAAAAPGHEDDDDQSISFLKEQQWRLPFGTTLAVERPIVPTVEVSGEVTTPPGGSADVGAPIAGRIVVPAAGLARPGDEVRVGQVLATLAPSPSSPEEAARASLVVAEAEARSASARSALERAERLVADRAISERELELARREAEVAGEAIAAARRAQRMFQSSSTGRGPGTYRLTAPIAGVLTEVRAAPGTSVSAGDVLFQIVDPSELWIRARVPEHDAPRVRDDEDASFRILGLEEWLPIAITGDAPQASVVSVGRTVHRASRTVDLIYSLHEPDPRLRVGATVRVAVPAGSSSSAVAIPRNAVLQDEGRDVVYVQIGGESFDERAVRVGNRAGAWVAIESGVEAGERVVSRGANLIRLAARAATEPSHGHVH